MIEIKDSFDEEEMSEDQVNISQYTENDDLGAGTEASADTDTIRLGE